MGSDRVQHIRQALTDYLRRRPNAADTLEGIMQWWLGDALRNSTRADVEEALAQMCAEGTLEHTGRIYRAAHLGDDR